MPASARTHSSPFSARTLDVGFEALHSEPIEMPGSPSFTEVMEPNSVDA